MKRSAPLRRKTALRSYSTGKGSRSGQERVCAADGCTNVFYNYPSRNQRFCSRACAYANLPSYPLSARKAKSEATLGKRRGRKNPNYKHGRRVGAHSRDRRRFQSFQTRCQHQSCPDPVAELCQHHVIYEQAVRRAGGDPHDGRNALAVCWSCHSSHHRGGRTIELRALRDSNFAFALELLGAGPAYEYLRRRYAGEDPRLGALLAIA